jgi:uncharacterized protein YjbI with pentapeptide repeats
MPCKIPGCREINPSDVADLCVFHAPPGKKKYSLDKFNGMINDKIKHGDFNFRGYIFPGPLSLYSPSGYSGELQLFESFIDFSEAEFHLHLPNPNNNINKINFNDYNFKGGVSFNNAIFFDEVTFENTEFHIIDFSKCKFNKMADFTNSIFFNDAIMFNCVFNQMVVFYDTDFKKAAYFSGTYFGTIADFISVKFMKGAYFGDCTLGIGTLFDNIILGPDSVFQIDKLTFGQKSNNHQYALIFNKIKFQPHSTYFENIEIHTLLPTIAFRNCILKDSYFINCQMKAFSFYQSIFNEAQFIRCNWPQKREKVLKYFPYRRMSLLSEEYLINAGSSVNIVQEFSQYSYGFTNDGLNYYEIALLYQRMKASMDRAKNFHEGSYFYFNEFEMKRLSLKFHEFRSNYFKRLLYWLYKIFAGYGEKPIWSIIWFFIFVLIFSLIYTYNGLIISEDSSQAINYDLNNITRDIQTTKYLFSSVKSFIFSFSRVIPANYPSLKMFDYYPNWPGGTVVMSFNSLILILFAIFTAIGLKRHFRRF